MSKPNVRRMFLEEFVKELIRNSTPAPPSATETEEIYEASNYTMPNTELPVAHGEEERQVISIMPPELPKTREAEQVQDSLDWGKVLPLIQDPSVNMIECPGPGKNVTVKQNGMMAATAFSLTKEEIRELLDRVQSITGTTAQEGILQAQTSFTTITGILSDYVGDRFIIQKKNQ